MGRLKVATTGDSHFDNRGRLADRIDVHREMVDAWRAAGVDLILHGGDVYERRSDPTERAAVREFLEAAAKVAPIVLARGNHDAPRDLALFNDWAPRIHVAEEPAIVFPLDGCAVLVVPWFDKAKVVAAQAGAIMDTTAATNRIGSALFQGLASMVQAARLRHPELVVLGVGHLQIAGARVASGQTLIGETVEVGAADLAETGAAYFSVGHIHMAQRWANDTVGYPGSPDRGNFGETEPKGWVLVELEGNNLANVSFEPLHTVRAMHRLELDLREDPGKWQTALWYALENVDLRGALVRVDYHLAEEQTALVAVDAIEAELRAHGAVQAKAVPTIERRQRVRAPDILTACNDHERLDSWLRAKGIDLDPAASERIHDKLGALVDADANA